MGTATTRTRRPRTAPTPTTHDARPCSDPRTCAALVGLGYLVVHCAQGEPWGLIALPNDHTTRPGRSGWLATPNTASGLTVRELRAIAHNRGGTVLFAEADDAPDLRLVE